MKSWRKSNYSGSQKVTEFSLMLPARVIARSRGVVRRIVRLKENDRISRAGEAGKEATYDEGVEFHQGKLVRLW